MQSKDNIINLEDFRVKEGNRISKVFTGRDRGEYVRKHSNIDQIEEKYSEITVIIPQNVYSINPSFLEEFLVHVVTKLGKENFLIMAMITITAALTLFRKYLIKDGENNE